MKTLLLRYAVLAACAAAQFRASGAGDPLDHWSQMDATGPIPAGAIRYGGGKWLGLDPDGRLVSSTNGLHWQVSRTFEAGESPGDLDYANGLWVLVGAQSTNVFVLTSEDGAVWERSVVPAIPPDVGGAPISYGLKVRRGGGEWVVRVGHRWVLKSTNGRNWALSVLGSPPEGEIWDLTYGDHKWVAQVKELDVFTAFPFACSTNLIDWEWWNPWPSGYAGREFIDLKFFNGVWFGVPWPMVIDGIAPFRMQLPVLTSTDGTNWIVRHVETNLSGLSIINGRLVALSYTGPGVVGGSGRSMMLTSDPLVSLQLATRGTLTVQRAAGMPVVVEWTEDFHTWQTLTNLASGQPLETVTDSSDGITKRFYRAHSP